MAATYSFTDTLKESNPEVYHKATHPEFARMAFQGQVSKESLGRWLASDIVYLHSYVKSSGLLLQSLDYSDLSNTKSPSNVLADWLIALLASISREENTINEAAVQYGLDITPQLGPDGRMLKSLRNKGSQRWEDLFGRMTVGKGDIPWLENAIIFFVNETVYHEVWINAQKHFNIAQNPIQDEDGGALRNLLTVSWTCKEFGEFIQMGKQAIDQAVRDLVGREGEKVKDILFHRVKATYDECLSIQIDFFDLN